jgi:type II secretory pathway pseudopilin PulG
MKNSTDRRSNAGFSMVELMTVIGIMILLAGILLASLPGIQTRVTRNKVETFLAELGAGLSKYQIDHGIYPQNPPAGDRDASGVDGAEVLYKHLSGDWDLDGAVDVETDEKVYVQKLSYDQNTSAKEPRSTSAGGKYFVVDSYGNPIRYLAQPPNIDPGDRLTINPTYDLWSIVDTEPEDDEDQARHITNWQSN